ncbi:hypothetical protein CU097_007107, partial [Rhizopus azygosporus]
MTTIVKMNRSMNENLSLDVLQKKTIILHYLGTIWRPRSGEIAMTEYRLSLYRRRYKANECNSIGTTSKERAGK